MRLKDCDEGKVFHLRSTDPSSSLKFSNRTIDYFDVTVETASMTACKKVSTYTYNHSDGFTEFFESLASQEKPWNDIKSWQPLEADMSLEATCDSLGHIAIKVILGEGLSTKNCWSLECTLYFDFGMLPKFGKDAKNFYAN